MSTPTSTGKAEPVTTETADRNDLAELAAFLNEFRVTWRPLDWPERDRMRGMALETLYRFRAQQGAAVPQPPDDCPWDVADLVDASREQLLSALRTARFNEAQLRGQLEAVKAGTDRMSLERAVGKAASVRVRYHSRSAGWSSNPEYVKAKLARYTEILTAAGWTVEAGEYELIVTAKEADR